MDLSDTIQEHRYIKLEVDHLTFETGGRAGVIWSRHEFVSNVLDKDLFQAKMETDKSRKAQFK